MQICNPGFKTRSMRSKNFNAHYVRIRRDVARRLCSEGLSSKVFMLPTGVRPDALVFNRGTSLAEALANGCEFAAAVQEYARVNCHTQNATRSPVSFYFWDNEPITITHSTNGALSWQKRQARKIMRKKEVEAMPKIIHSYENVDNLFDYYPHNNTLAIHSDAITPNDLRITEAIAWMRRPYAERIAESPYRDQINAEIAKHPDCKLTEFIDGPLF